MKFVTESSAQQTCGKTPSVFRHNSTHPQTLMSRSSSGSVLFISIYANSQPQTSVGIGFISLALSLFEIKFNCEGEPTQGEGTEW